MWTKEQRQKWQREYYKKKKVDPKYKKAKQKSAKKYYENNKEKCKESRKIYFEANKDKYRKYRREWRYNNPAGILEVIRTGAKRRNVKFNITNNEFAEWYINQDKKCFYCNRTFDEIKSEDDNLNNKINRLTVDRVDNNIGYLISNIVLACYRCNLIKGNYFTKNEMLKIGKIIYDKNNR